MKLHDLATSDPPADLHLLGPAEYTLLWVSGFHDGPLSGMLSHRGREYWFEMFRENEDDAAPDTWYRRYAVLELTAEQLAKEHEVHRDFQRYVGDQTERRPKDQWHLFYDKHLEYCRSRRYDGNEVVAWFQR